MNEIEKKKKEVMDLEHKRKKDGCEINRKNR